MLILSYSKINSYLNCPYHYRLKYMERVPERPRAHLRLGDVLHTTLGLFYEEFMETGEWPPLTLLLSLYDERYGQGRDRWHHEGAAILERYYCSRNDIDIEKRPYMVEQYFRVSLYGFVLAGRFDRVDVDAHGDFYIVDYKTAKTVKNLEELARDLQLSLYNLAFKTLTGECPVGLSFYYLRHNREVYTERSEEDAVLLERRLSGMLDEMDEGRYAPKKGRFCQGCDYREYCPEKGGRPEGLPEKKELRLPLQLWESYI